MLRFYGVKIKKKIFFFILFITRITAISSFILDFKDVIGCKFLFRNTRNTTINIPFFLFF